MTETLATQLVNSRLAGALLPQNPSVASEEEAYVVQENIIQNGRCGALVGWKCAFSAPAAYQGLGLSVPGVGPLFSCGLYGAGAPLDAERLNIKLVEAEIAFVLAEPLPVQDSPRSVAEVIAAVGHVLPCLEIVGSRLNDFASASGFAKVADAASNAGVVLGERVHASTVDFARLDSATCELRCTGRRALTGTGGSGAVEGHPVKSLTFISNFLNKRGMSLKAGDIVITGAAALYKGPFTKGEEFKASFEGLGSVSARLIEGSAGSTRSKL